MKTGNFRAVLNFNKLALPLLEEFYTNVLTTFNS